VLVVPVGQTILLNVRSTDVVHSFSAPHVLYKIQAIPGSVNQMHMRVTKAGTYAGQCYQFCGLRHSDMLFVLDAREPADYQQWLRETQAAQGIRASDQARSGGEN
jgi:cytochrome c oxidase subunit 2